MKREKQGRGEENLRLREEVGEMPEGKKGRVYTGIPDDLRLQMPVFKKDPNSEREATH